MISIRVMPGSATVITPISFQFNLIKLITQFFFRGFKLLSRIDDTFPGGEKILVSSGFETRS